MKHCIELTDLTKEEILDLISLAEKIIEKPKDYSQSCAGKQLATLFYEPSTRTRLSFTSAMLALGGSVLGFSDAQNSSVSKGETMADTSIIVSNYADILAIRHFKEGAPFVASQYSTSPVINAGDGSHAHPTQTLTDLLTIHKELGRLNNLKIGLCGDLKYGRTVHSLIKAMNYFDNIHFVLISSSNLQLPEYLINEYPNISFSKAESIEDAVADLDILYMTRVQKERFDSIEEYENCKDNFILDEKKMSLANENMIVLHPLPRVNEITIGVDKDPRAAYFRQAKNGKFIRMALIYTLLKSSNNERSPIENKYIINYNKCKNKNCITQTEELPNLGYTLKDKNYCSYCDSLID